MSGGGIWLVPSMIENNEPSQVVLVGIETSWYYQGRALCEQNRIQCLLDLRRSRRRTSAEMHFQGYAGNEPGLAQECIDVRNLNPSAWGRAFPPRTAFSSTRAERKSDAAVFSGAFSAILRSAFSRKGYSSGSPGSALIVFQDFLKESHRLALSFSA